MTAAQPTANSCDVWLVVLNWNGRADTMALLEGLAREPATILVVDNGSTDGTLEEVHEQFPGVRTLQTGANLGYAGGNNAGISLALAAGADVVGVLNNDTLVKLGFLRPLLDAIADGAFRAVTPDIRYARSPEVSWFRGGYIDESTGWPRHLTPAEQPPPDGEPFSSPLLTGCCMVASASTWRLVGKFDDGLFLIFEDSDWSTRATTLGVELKVIPASQILHKVSRSFTGRTATIGSYYFARNGLIFAWRHLGKAAAMRFLFHHLIRVSLREMFKTQMGCSAALMRCLGILAALTGQRGAAGQFVSWVAGQLTSRKVERHA